MIRGEFLQENLLFERNRKNIRRMHRPGLNITPFGNNNKLWSPCLSSENLIEDSEKGAFEIFMELARLKTSIA